MHILGNYGHIHTKYEVLCVTLWVGGVCTDNDANDDDGQSMIVLGSLLDKPNEPNITYRFHSHLLLQSHNIAYLSNIGNVYTSQYSSLHILNKVMPQIRDKDVFVESGREFEIQSSINADVKIESS